MKKQKQIDQESWEGATHLSIHPVDRETGEVKRIAELSIPKNLAKDFAEKLNKKVMDSMKASQSLSDN